MWPKLVVVGYDEDIGEWMLSEHLGKPQDNSRYHVSLLSVRACPIPSIWALLNQHPLRCAPHPPSLCDHLLRYVTAIGWTADSSLDSCMALLCTALLYGYIISFVALCKSLHLFVYRAEILLTSQALVKMKVFDV